jgi:intracellular septation protein
MEKMDLTRTAAPHAEAGPLLRLGLDLGPLLVYFVAYSLTGKNIYAATGIFMAATGVAMVTSLLRFGRISPMQWFSSTMVLLLGGLTIWLHKDWLIKMKPTFYYLMVSGVLGFGLMTGKPTLKLALGTAYPGLNERGWMILSRNWALFFVAMAVANEFVWRHYSTDFWLGYKLWGAVPATMLFAIANVPMLMKNGLGESAIEAVADGPPEE